MPLSWNEIKHRAIKFSREWKTAVSEKSERQTALREIYECKGYQSRKSPFIEGRVLPNASNSKKRVENLRVLGPNNKKLVPIQNSLDIGSALTKIFK